MSRSYKYQDNSHLQQQQRSLFLPIMLCSRSSLKDVKISHRRASSDDSSPEIGCRGQVKRNNKVTGFPPPRLLNFPSNPAIKTDCKATATGFNYQKLKRFFSSKSLNCSPAKIGYQISTSNDLNCRTNNTCNIRSDCDGDFGVGRDSKPVESMINLAELDPPLPVVRQAPPLPESGQARERENLWKRRSGGMTLKSLQVQFIHGGAANLGSVEANTV